MGFRQASGTKPTQLRNPVPTVDQESFNQEQLNQVPQSQMRSPASEQQMAQPMPSPTPAPQSAADDLDTAISLPDDLDAPMEIAAAPVEREFMGRKFRSNPESPMMEVYDEKEKKWKIAGPEYKTAASLILSGIADSLPMGGELIGGLGGSYLGGPAGGVIGSTAGAATGAAYSKDLLAKLRENPDSANYLSFLEELSGKNADPMSPLMAGTLGAIGGTVGEVLSMAGKGMKTEAKLLEQSAEKNAAIAASEAATAQEAGKITGVDLMAAQVAKDLPGGSAAKGLIKGIENKSFGQGLRDSYQALVSEQKKKLADYASNIKGILGEYVQKGTTGLTKVTNKAFEESGENVVDRYIGQQRATLGLINKEIDAALGGKLQDVKPLFEGIKNILSQLPAESLVLKDGKISMKGLSEYYAKHIPSNQDRKIFVEQIQSLVNISRAAEVLEKQGLKGTESGLGMTFKQISSSVDEIQQLAAKYDDPYLKKLAGTATSFERGLIESSGIDDQLIKKSVAAKDYFSQNIRSLSDMASKFKTGLRTDGALADAFLTSSADEVRLMKTILSEQEMKEAAGMALNKAFVNDVIQNPDKLLNVEYLRTKFLGDRYEAMTELFGKDAMKNIEAVLNIAKHLDNPKITASQAEAVSGKVVEGLMKIKHSPIVSPIIAALKITTNANEKAAAALFSKLDKIDMFIGAKDQAKKKLAGAALEAGGELFKRPMSKIPAVNAAGTAIKEFNYKEQE